MNRSQKLLALATALSVTLTSCSEKKDVSPAAMKINGQVITASELARTAVQGVPGTTAAAANVVDFTVREGLELLAPDNYLPTNPQLLEQTRVESGR